MPKKTFTSEEIVSKAREAEVLFSQGQAIVGDFAVLDNLAQARHSIPWTV